MAVLGSTGNQTVTTAGTSVALPSTAGIEVNIKAFFDNTGVIYVKPGGTAGTDYRRATGTTTAGYELSAGQAITIPIDGNTNQIIIDASANSQGISFMTTKVQAQR